MSWKGDGKNWTSKPFIVGNRKGTVTQHHILAFTVKKKPGHGRCVAKYGLRDRDRLLAPPEVKNESRRPKTVWSYLQFDAPDSMSRKLIG